LLRHELQLDEGGAISACDDSTTSSCTGAVAIEKLLSLVDDDALPAGLRGRTDARSAIVVRSILVIPADLRPLILLESGNFATSDLNDLYRRVINRSNRLRKLKELNAPWKIILNERLQLQRGADALFANSLLRKVDRVLSGNNRVLRDMLDISLSRIRKRIHKRVDYSARARAVPSSAAGSETASCPMPNWVTSIPTTSRNSS
jgi:DNA-directed RNA polymerase beta' subunit